MADIKPIQQRKRQKVLLIVSFGIFLAAGLVLYFGVWQGGAGISIETFAPPAEIDTLEIRSAVVEKKLERINLDFTYLLETMLPFLKSHGDLPVEKGTTGRENPFVPY